MEDKAFIAASKRVEVKRGKPKGSYDPKVVNAIIDEGFLAHVGVSTPEGPIVLPMIYGRSDSELYLHGSVANALLRGASDAELCATITLVDALVVARSAFHHSMNYRSVVVRGQGRKVQGAEKMDALELITNHIVQRWEDSRQPTTSEVKQTLVLAVPLTESSAKIRTGDPIDDEADLAGPWWAGLVPLRQSWGPTRDAADLTPGIDVPEAVESM